MIEQDGDQKMLNIVNDENGNELEKKDAIFLAFIADYGRNAVKNQKGINIKMPESSRKEKRMSRAEKQRLERIEQ